MPRKVEAQPVHGGAFILNQEQAILVPLAFPVKPHTHQNQLEAPQPNVLPLPPIEASQPPPQPVE